MHLFKKLILLSLFLLPSPLLPDPPSPLLTTQEIIAGQTPDKQKAPLNDVQIATESYESTFTKTIIVLVGLLTLLFLTVWAFKKISQGRLHSFNAIKAIKVIEKRPLSPKSMLYLIEIKGKQLLIVESQIQVRKLMTLIDETSLEKDF